MFEQFIMDSQKLQSCPDFWINKNVVRMPKSNHPRDLIANKTKAHQNLTVLRLLEFMMPHDSVDERLRQPELSRKTPSDKAMIDSHEPRLHSPVGLPLQRIGRLT